MTEVQGIGTQNAHQNVERIVAEVLRALEQFETDYSSESAAPVPLITDQSSRDLRAQQLIQDIKAIGRKLPTEVRSGDTWKRLLTLLPSQDRPGQVNERYRWTASYFLTHLQEIRLCLFELTSQPVKDAAETAQKNTRLSDIKVTPELAQALKKSRQLLGQSQQAVHEQVDLSVDTISSIELCKKSIQPDTLVEVLKYVNIALDQAIKWKA